MWSDPCLHVLPGSSIVVGCKHFFRNGDFEDGFQGIFALQVGVQLPHESETAGAANHLLLLSLFLSLPWFLKVKNKSEVGETQEAHANVVARSLLPLPLFKALNPL